MDGKKFDKNTLKTLVITASLLLNCNCVICHLKFLRCVGNHIFFIRIIWRSR